MPPKFSEMKVLSDSERRKLQKEREAEKKRIEEENLKKAAKIKLISILVTIILMVVLIVAFYYSHSKRTEVILQKQAKQIEIKFPIGEIFKLDPNTKVWEKPNTNIIEEKSGLRIGKGGSVTLSLPKNRQIKIYENSEILFEQIESSVSDIEALNIKVKFKGKAVFEFSALPCVLNIDTEVLTITLPENVAAIFKIEQYKKSNVEHTRVAVKGGRVQVLNKKTKALYDLETATEMIMDRNFQITGPARFLASSEAF